MNQLRKIATIVLIAFTAILVAGCSTTSNKSSELSSQDIMFAEMMIPHHEQAIVMSDLALSKSSNPEILKLAQEIKDAQNPEIELMSNWAGVDASTHMGHTMMGMLSDEEIDELKVANGSTFDRLFLEGMIKHHEGAIDMAGMIDDSSNTEVAQLGKNIISTQRAEIALMKELLAKFNS